MFVCPFRPLLGRWLIVVGGLGALAVIATPLQSQQDTVAALVGDNTSAGYNDLAVAPDGTLHAIWQDRPQNDRRFTVFYRGSRDGVRWSPPIDLDPTEATASTVRAAIDGASRVYAIWKSRAPAMTTAELNATNSMNASHGTLMYRVLEGGRWSAPARLGRRNCVYGWFVGLGPDGRVQVVWSETPDGDPDSAFDAVADAKAVQRARLDGGTARSERLFDAPVGLYGLHGYIDARDRPHFAALGGDDLLYFDGSRLTRTIEGHRPRDKRSAPKLLRDRAGADHVVVYTGDNIVDLRPGAVRTIVPLPAGSAVPVDDVLVAQGGDGRMFVAAALRDSVDADFVLSWSDGGAWSPPVSLTGTGERARGVLTSNALGFSSTSRVLGIFASMAVEPSGSLGVLLTAGVARMNNSRQYGGGYSIGSFEPKVFFARVNMAGLRYVPPPALGAQPSPTPSAPNPPNPSHPVPSRAPAPPSSSTALPAGRYGCDRLSEYAGLLPSGLAVVIRDGRYEMSGAGEGNFSASGTAVRWTSGPLAAPQAKTAVVEKNGSLIIRLVWDGAVHECKRDR